MTPSNLRARLVELGRTADEVAAALEAQGVTGYKRDQYHCPLCHWLEAQGVSAPAVAPSESGLRWAYGGRFYSMQPADVPEAITTFTRRFDHGHYPALVVTRGDR